MLKIRDTAIGEGIPKICVSVMGSDMQSLRLEALKLYDHSYDIVEWRMDYFGDVSSESEVMNALRLLRSLLGDIPLIATFRTKAEGGVRELKDGEYAEILRWVIKSGLADIVDIELFSGDENVSELIKLAEDNGVFTILSSHDFEKTPSCDEMLFRLRKMDDLGCSMAKLAVMPRSKRDVVSLLSATEEASRNLKCPVITMSMGAMGSVSRLCGEAFGSCLTFGCIGKPSAPGQVDTEELTEGLRIMHDALN